MRYYFIAGEASGDIHAANCMREVIKRDSEARFAYTGGDRMQEICGVKPTVHLKEMAFMGFLEVLRNIGSIKRNFKTVKKDILDFKPDLLVLVDYPGFNLRMAKWAKQQGIKTDYYISPSVWAWKENRVEIIRNYVNKLFVILPFEEAFYQKHGIKVYFTGHPLVDAIEEKKARLKSREQFINSNGLNEKPIVAVLPGSRVQELERMLEIMTTTVKKFQAYQFVIAGSDNLPQTYYEQARQKNIHVVYNQTYELMSHARAGIIKSGTSTLESALLKLPQVVCYKTGNVSFAIGKRLIKLNYISLPNLVVNKQVVKELIQNDFTEDNICQELERLLHDEMYRQAMISEYEKLPAMLEGKGASARVAEYLVKDARAEK